MREPVAAVTTAEATIIVLPAMEMGIPALGAITVEITAALPVRRRGRAIKIENAADRDKIKTAMDRTALMVKTEGISKTDRALIIAPGKTRADRALGRGASVQAAVRRALSPR